MKDVRSTSAVAASMQAQPGQALSRRGALLTIGGLAALPFCASLAAGSAALASPLPGSGRPRPRQSSVMPCPVPAIERRVQARGGKLYSRANGPFTGAGLPALFLHGGPGGTHLGMVGALPLADSRAIILYDQLDCGRSDRPNDRANWTVERFVSEIDSMREAYGLDNFHLSGTSWGGTLALEYAARQPAGLKSLTLFSPLVSTKSWLADADIYIRELPMSVQYAIEEARRTQNFDSFTFQEADRLYANLHLSREHLSPLHLACQGRSDPGFNLALYLAMWGPSEFIVTGSLRDYDGEHLLPLVTAPTLLVSGEYDEARPDTMKMFAARMQNARYKMVPGSGHWIENDRPADHQALLRSWLGSND